MSKGPDLAAVPNVVGQSQTEAEATLKAAGFDMGEVTESYSGSVGKGKVVSQDPQAGAQASKGSPVSIVISKGPEMVNVPSVVGLSQALATERLSDAGLQAQVETETSSTAAEGNVISQNPTVGESVPKGSKVTIKVAKQAPKVPNVIGSLKADAENTLVGAGFSVTVINQATADPTKVGRVINQDPPPLSDAPAGSSVKIYVGIAP